MASILYCGDTDLTSAAAYLAGVMTHFRLDYEYIPSHVPLSREQVEQPRRLFVFSDYPAAMLSADLQAAVVDQVRQGSGLLMIGGWESFHGLGGDWDGTPVGNALPVEIATVDDRVNFAQSAYLRATGPHAILEGLPWERPPAIGGMNRAVAKPESQVVLSAVPVEVAKDQNQWRFVPTAELPLLVTGLHGRGRTAAIMTDVAPHWVGGFVDWGDERVTAQAAGAGAIEVGNWYARFWRQLIEGTVAAGA